MADPILFWNDVALEANRVSHSNQKEEQTGPPLSARALAIVHLAMYDAFAGTNASSKLPPYLQLAPAPHGASSDAAVAAAAHATLSDLFPSQREFFTKKLQEAPGVVGGGSDGLDYGMQVARAILDDRKTDPGVGSAGYLLSNERGRHRKDPDNPDQGVHAPFYGARARNFAATARQNLGAPPSHQPGSPTHGEYLKALRQVREKGIAPELMGTLPVGTRPRIPEETVIGLYWAYDGAAELGTPPRLYNQIIRVLAEKRKNTTADNARLFAFVNVALADAGIQSWYWKYVYDVWRPVLGIREHDLSVGPSGKPGSKLDPDGDPGWLPLGAPSTNAEGQGREFSSPCPIYPSVHMVTGMTNNFTPPFPAYPSGHATFGAAAFQIARLFYGEKGTGPDKLFDGLSFVSEELNGKNRDNRGTVRTKHTREFPRGLWQMIEENGFSRVYLGVHWSFDAFLLDASGDPIVSGDVGGVPLGIAVAENIFKAGNGMGPQKP